MDIQPEEICQVVPTPRRAADTETFPSYMEENLYQTPHIG